MNQKVSMQGFVAVLGLLPFLALAGNGPAYSWDEAQSPDGPNRCKTNEQCDGARTCTPAGYCQGEARPPATVPPAWFSLKAINNDGNCIEVRDGMLKNAPCSKSDAQLFWASAQSGYRTLKSKANGKCITGGEKNQLTFSDCGLADNQRWMVDSTNKPDAVVLRLKTLNGAWLGSGGANTTVQMYNARQGVPGQYWKLIASVDTAEGTAPSYVKLDKDCAVSNDILAVNLPPSLSKEACQDACTKQKECVAFHYAEARSSPNTCELLRKLDMNCARIAPDASRWALYSKSR